jgi:hypothetical protein
MTMTSQYSFSRAPLPLVEPVFRPVLRRLAVRALERASAGLARTAARLETAAPTAPDQTAQPCVEFHADSGALEGALYVDGRLVATLPGVKRL